MAAPDNNNFWELRSSHGRKRLFASPKLLWTAACEYFTWCTENPLIELDFRGKDSNEVKLPKMRPFTMIGLCHYLDCNLKYFDDFESSLKDKKEDDDKKKKQNDEFASIITRIRETVFNQKFTGAASGFLNPNIIARDLGLVEKKDVNNKLDFVKLAEKLSDDDLVRIAEQMLKQSPQQ